MKLKLRYKGGKGSGNFNHAGRPGLVGGSLSRSWEGFPLRSDVGEAPTSKDVPPIRDSYGNFVVYHGTTSESANAIIDSRTLKKDDIGAVGITTLPKLARSFGVQKGDPVVLEIVVDKDWMAKQKIRHEVGGAGHSSFLIKSEIPSSAIVGIRIYDGNSIVEKGGPGSGHRGHRGRPGKRGGALPDNASVMRIPDGVSVDEAYDYAKFILHHEAGAELPKRLENIDATIGGVMHAGETLGEWAAETTDKITIDRLIKDSNGILTEEDRSILQEIAVISSPVKGYPGYSLQYGIVIDDDVLNVSDADNLTEWGIEKYGIRPAFLPSVGRWELDNGKFTIHIAKTSPEYGISHRDVFWHEFGHTLSDYVVDHYVGEQLPTESSGEHMDRFAAYMSNRQYRNVVEKQHDTVIVAFDFVNEYELVVAQQEFAYLGKPSVPMHMTLLFLGDVDKVDVEDVKSKVAEFAKKMAPISGVVNGIAKFSNEEDALVVLVDSVELPGFRQELRNMFPDIEQNHGFTPHITLVYGEDLKVPYFKPDIHLTIDKIYVYAGDDKFAYDLEGTTVFKGGPGSGHFGHSGRPGKVGGSESYLHVLSSWDELQNFATSRDGYTRAAWITPNNVLIGLGEDAHPSILSKLAKNHKDDLQELFGIIPEKEDESDTFAGEYSGYSLMDKAFANGAIRVRFTEDELNVETSYRDNKTLRRLQRLVDSDILGYRKFVVWDATNSDDPSYSERLKVPWENFIGAKHVVVENYDPKAPWVSGNAVLKQLPIDDDSKANLIEIRKELFNEEVDTLAESMYTGDISIGQWEESMKKLIRELHSSVAAIGKGGWDQMTWSDWGRLGPEMQKQYKYLHGFADKIATDRDTISIEAIKARAHMYANAAGHSAYMIEAGQVLTDKLPWMPRDGSTKCLVNCQCEWLLDIIDREGDFNIVQATWKLNPAEHCVDCIGRNGYVHMLKVYKDIIVPKSIGGY